MTQSILSDAQPVPENPISSQETDERKQGVNRQTALIIVSVLLGLSVIGLVAAFIILRQYFCPDKWIGLQDNCYYFSNDERNWSSSRNYCFTKHADLTVIDSTDIMDFLSQHKCNSDHWIGLKMKGNQTGKWVNGTIFNQLFQVRGNETCAYLSDDGVATARCYTERKFICRHKKSTR